MNRWQATYQAIGTDASIGDFRTLEAHALSWRQAAQHLPRWIYPEGRRYRRISGPTTKEAKL
jgi:hypothetical protein